MRRYSEAVKADVRLRMIHLTGRAWLRSQRSWASNRHPLQLVEDLEVAGRGGAGIREGTRRLECCRQVSVVLDLVGFNAIELSTCCIERACSPSRRNSGGMHPSMPKTSLCAP